MQSALPAFRVSRVMMCLLVMLSATVAEAQSKIGTPRLMQGPVLGPVTQHSVTVWARASGEFAASVRYATTPDLENGQTSPAVQVQQKNDFCVQIPVTGLAPGTQYHYEVLLDGKPGRPGPYDGPASFTTAPEGPAAFSFAFGSCARLSSDPVQLVWKTAQSLEPDLFFWVGDNVYGDSLHAATVAEEYRREREVPLLAPFLRSTPQLAVWDDHDFGLNDHNRTNPVKEDMLEVFKRYWPNPSYGLEGTPGVFFTYSYGGADFFLVDCRYHRDPNDAPDTPEKTFLGAEQLAWLKASLQKSSAPFKFLISGSGWTAAKGEGGDSWSAFLHERNALFDFIQAEGIEGVVLLSGDTHTGELNCIPRSEQGGYDLYDLVSSPLAQKASQGWRRRNPEVRLRDGFEQPNVGLIEVDMTSEDPTLTFNLYGEDGNPAWAPLVLRASELKNGVSSHPSKQ